MPITKPIGFFSSPFLSFVYLLLFFASCLYPSESGIVLGSRFHHIHNPQADIKFTRTATSEIADPAKKHLDDGA